MKFAIYDAPGFDSNNSTRRWSAHRTLAAARREARRHVADIPGQGPVSTVIIAEAADDDEFRAGRGSDYSDALRGRGYRWHSAMI